MGGKNKKQKKKSAKHSKKPPSQHAQVKYVTTPKTQPRYGLYFVHQEQKRREEEKREFEKKLKPQVVKLMGLRDGKLISVNYVFSDENQTLRSLRWVDPYDPSPSNWWNNNMAPLRQDFAKEMLAPAGSYEVVAGVPREKRFAADGTLRLCRDELDRLVGMEVDDELVRDQSNILYTIIMNNKLIIDESLDTHVKQDVQLYYRPKRVKRTPQENYEHPLMSLKESEQHQSLENNKTEEQDGGSTDSDDRKEGSENKIEEGNSEKAEENIEEVLAESMEKMSLSTGESFSGANGPEASVGPSGNPGAFTSDVFKYKKKLLPPASKMSCDLPMDVSKMTSANFHSEATVAPGESEAERTKDVFIGSTSANSTKLFMDMSETLAKSDVESGGREMSTDYIPEEASSSSKFHFSAEKPFENVAENDLKKAPGEKASAAVKAEKEGSLKQTTG